MKTNRAKVREVTQKSSAQGGYVVYGGRKVKIKGPRVRGKDGSEVNLDTYGAFQGEGKVQKSVARQLMRTRAPILKSFKRICPMGADKPNRDGGSL